MYTLTRVRTTPFLVYVTVPDREEALRIARAVVESGLAAGCNVLPGVRSVYRWQGGICEADECMLFAQVSDTALNDFCSEVRRQHSHRVPCIVALPLAGGHEPFFHWINENSLPASEDAGRHM